MTENPAANPAASADQSSEAPPPATVLLRTDGIPQISKSPKLKCGDVALVPGKDNGGDGGNHLAAVSGVPKNPPSKLNHSQHQPDTTNAKLLLFQNPAARQIWVCCTSKRPTSYRFEHAPLHKLPPGWEDINFLCDQREIPKMLKVSDEKPGRILPPHKQTGILPCFLV